MGLSAADVKLGAELAPLTKHMTLEKMQWFSGGEGRSRKENLHTDAAAAERDAGMKQPFASGRMSLGYACELMSRYVGVDQFSRTGTVDFKFIRPVMPGDTLTVRGRVAALSPAAEGTLVTVELSCENQRGEKVSVGSGTAVVPSR